MVLQLVKENPIASLLINNHTKTAVDVTVLMIALLQLDTEWDATRKDIMSRVLLVKTMSLKQRKDQMNSLGNVMQPFIMKYPEVCSECILKSYETSLSKPEYSSFFSLLFDSCCNIPSFIPLLKNTIRIPVKPNLYLIVHLYFLEWLLMNNTVELDRQMQELLESSKLNLVTLLIDLLSEYHGEHRIILERPQFVQWTIGFLDAIVDERHIPPHLVQRYTMVKQSVLSKMQSNPRMIAIHFLQQWLQVQSIEERNKMISQMNSLSKSQDGIQVLSQLADEAVGQLEHVTAFQEYEAYNLADLIVFLANSDLLTESCLVFVMNILSVLLKNNSPFFKLGFYLLSKLEHSLERNPIYVQRVLGTQFVKGCPVLASKLQNILANSQAVMGRGNDVMSPSMPSPVSVPVTPHTMTKEQIVVAKKRQQEIMQPIVPLSEEVIDKIPDERVKNRVSVLINNITSANISSKVDDFCGLIQGYEKWFADMLVRSRVERQTNYHELYLDLVDRLSKKLGPMIMDYVMESSIQVTKELLTADYSVFIEKHSFLKIMGEWLGTMTIGRDVCLSQYHMNLSQQLYVAFYHKRLLYVYEFVCFVLRACRKSKVLHPPQPWLMSLLSLLKEIREIPGIVNKVGYLYDNFLSNNGYKDSDIVVQNSDLYLAIPEVANNNDFSETASQAEVFAYFQKRYPQLPEFTPGSENTLKAIMNSKNSFHEFYPKTMKSLSPVTTPAPAANLPPRDDCNFAVVIPTSLQQDLQPSLLLQLRKMVDDVMTEIASLYMQSVGMSHRQIVLGSLQGMYYRDFLEIKDIKEVMSCLEKPAKTMVQSVLFLEARELERKFIQKMNSLSLNRSMVSDESIEEIVKLNTPVFLDVIQYQCVHSVMEVLIQDIQNDKQTENGLKQRQKLNYQEFLKTDGIQRNEVVRDGVFTDDQKKVYTLFADGPSLDSALMDDEDLHHVTVEVAYGKIRNLLQNIIEYEKDKEAWNTQFDLADIRGDYPELLSLFDTIRNHHIPKEDNTLIDMLVSIIRRPDFFNEFHIMVVVVKIAQFLDSQDVCSTNGKQFSIGYEFTRLILKIVEQIQKQIVIPFLLLLATNGLLDIQLFDEAMASLVKTSQSFVDASNRFVFLCLSEIVIVHEAVQPNELPETMKEIERLSVVKDIKYPGDAPKNSFLSLFNTLCSKQDLIRQRSSVNEFMKSSAYSAYEDTLLLTLDLGMKNDSLALSTKLTELISLFDKTLKLISENALYSLLYASFDSVYTSFYDRIRKDITLRAPSAIMPFFTSFFGQLIQRESKEKRVSLHSFILSAFRSHFYVCHDVNHDSFVPAYFSSFLFNWLKQIILEEKDTAVRQQFLIDYAHLLFDFIPQSAPSFIVAWVQLISTPQVLSILIGERNQPLATITGDMIIRLLSFFHSVQVYDLQQVTQKLVEHVIYLLRTILTSFPGFLCRRSYELIPLLPDELCMHILMDCPPEFNYTRFPAEEQNAMIDRLWTLPVEPNMPYKQEIARFGLGLEALDMIMTQQNVDQGFNMMFRAFDMSGNRITTLLRAIIIYWIMEEEVVVKRAADPSACLPASNCIVMLIQKLNQNSSYFFSILGTMINYIRFPCKETRLFMKAFLGLYQLVDNDTRGVISKVLMKRMSVAKPPMGLMLICKRIQMSY